jgi:hypothetical protein
MVSSSFDAQPWTGKYTTPAEMDAKARQKLELQEALERQIAEKQWAKEEEKRR